jgi:hypothetical protein
LAEVKMPLSRVFNFDIVVECGLDHRSQPREQVLSQSADEARLKIIILDALHRQTPERHDRRAGTSWALKVEMLVLEDRQCVELCT